MTPWRRFTTAIISIFILVHVLTIVLWITPPFPLYWSILPPFRQYICLIGFWNTWTMFCHPKTWNGYVVANVTCTNGTVIQWEFPRMEKLDYITRAQKERYRKWTQEYVNEPDFAFVLPEACAFVARQVQTKTAQPSNIELVRHWTWIQPPAGFGDSVSKGDEQYSFYQYTVKPEDLQ
jgi:hypothetical protein